MEILGIIFVGLFIILAINAGMIIRHRIFAGEFPTKKILIIGNIIIVAIFILYSILPKSNNECKVNFIINNKKSVSEIIINKEYIYNLIDNEEKKLNNMESNGSIAIKTKDEAVIVCYFDDTHLFKMNHKIYIEIYNNKISISSFPKLSIGKITDDMQIYDKILYLFK